MTQQEKQVKQKLLALRNAACAWSDALWEAPKDVKDSHFRRIDKRLQRTAFQFAEVVKKAQRDER